MNNQNKSTCVNQLVKPYGYLKKWKIVSKYSLCLLLLLICFGTSYMYFKKNHYSSELLLDAVLSQNIEATSFLLGKKTDINYKYKYGHTLLHSAALYGDLKMVKLLVQKDAKLLKNEFGLTAIDSARDMNHIDVLEYLEKSYY